jgi:hypothetical protein
MMLPFKKCNRAILREMSTAFYEREVSIPEDPTLDYKWSPAEVNQILFRNFTDPETAVKELVGLASKDLTGIVENGTDLESIVPRTDE